MARFKWTTLSSANQRHDLPRDPSQKPMQSQVWLSRQFERQSDPLKSMQRDDLQKTEQERRDIAALAREKRHHQPQGRNSKMVAKDRPEPVLKPSPALAHGTDAARFNNNWQAEKRAALRADLTQQQKELQGLDPALRTLDEHLSIAMLATRADQRDAASASRDAFKATRRAQVQSEQVFSRSKDAISRAEAFLSQSQPNLKRGSRR